MRMKNKIRRAYDHAAPDVWGNVLQELPAQKSATAPRPIPTQKKTSQFREFAATAAAALLLIAVAGGAVWYFGNFGGSSTGSTNPSSPTGGPNFTNPSDTTPPIDPWRDVYVEDLDYMAENILYPFYMRDSIYEEPEVKTPLSEVCTDSVYVLEKTMGSYTYEFHFDSRDGKLLAIMITNYSDTVTEFIPETVAKAIVLLNEDLLQTTLSSQLYQVTTQLVKTGSSGYYYITVADMEQQQPKEYYIHAQTGELLDLGEEVESGYTVGPAPEISTPDGLIPEELAIRFATEQAGVTTAYNVSSQYCYEITAYLVSFDDGKYYYELTIDAYTGDILSFPNPVLIDDVITPPDGNIGADLALETALNYLGITKEQASNYGSTFVNNDVEGDHYLVTLDYDDTHFVIKVGAYNPSVLSCEKYEATGATAIMARNYALDYVGISIDNVSCLEIEVQEAANEQDNPGFLIRIVCEGIEYQFSLDYYGAVQSCEELEVGLNADESRTDIIGWRAARDIYVEDCGMTLDDLTAFRYEYVSSQQYPDRYVLYVNGYTGILVAKSGEYFYEGDGDGSPVYDTAILTADEITEIVLMDVSQEIRENYAAGAYSQCYIDTRVCYGGGVREHDIQLYYEWFLYADGLYVTYQVDAFTGEILLQYVDASGLLIDLFDEWGSWYNMALSCEFENPSMLELSTFFYNGFPDESQTPTDEELAGLQAAGVYWDEADLIRLPSGRMNEILIQYFGITLEEMDESCFDGLTYLESTDCYYMMHTGANCVEAFSIKSLETLENGNLAVQYTSSRTGSNVWYMELEPWGTGYRILMNFTFLYRD